MKIVLIGAGNVATHLGRKLVEVGHEVGQIFSRDLQKAKLLGELLAAAQVTSDLDEITNQADLYIIAVHDDAIGEVAGHLAKIGLDGKLIVHTSGATPMQVFAEAAPGLNHVGVFYPLQTFSKIRQPNFQQIPICVDAQMPEDLMLLQHLGNQLSDQVYHINDEQRATLHLAAVFVNNFTNHLFAIGENILKEGNLSFQLLLPLIRETVGKLEDGSPAAMQTGPAIRYDVETIRRHLLQLEGQPGLQEIYQLLTKSIQQTQ